MLLEQLMFFDSHETHGILTTEPLETQFHALVSRGLMTLKEWPAK